MTDDEKVVRRLLQRSFAASNGGSMSSGWYVADRQPVRVGHARPLHAPGGPQQARLKEREMLAAYAEALRPRFVTREVEDDDGILLEIVCRVNTVEEVGLRMMKPKRPLNEEASWIAQECRGEPSAGIRSSTIACETYEARGLVPPGWFGGDEGRRCFVGYCDDRCLRGFRVGDGGGFVLCHRCLGSGLATYREPQHRVEAEVLAADYPNLATVEECAMAAASALCPWGYPAAQRVAWKFVSSHRDESPRRPIAGEVLGDKGRGNQLAIELCRGNDDRLDMLLRQPHESHAQHALRIDVSMFNWFKELSDDAEVVPERVRHRVGSKREQLLYSDLPNPFAPILDIWRMGYALDLVRDGLVVIACPIP